MTGGTPLEVTQEDFLVLSIGSTPGQLDMIGNSADQSSTNSSCLFIRSTRMHAK